MLLHPTRLPIPARHAARAALPALVVLALALPAAAAFAQEGATTLRDIGLATPESVLHLAGPDVYLVSNIAGAPLDPDGNGFIARLAPDGTVVDARWIDGAADGVTLNAPKGMAAVGDTLYVADIDTLRMFDLASGAPTGAVAVPGASFLNDVAAGPDGAVYVTDSGLDASLQPSGSDAIYRYADGELSTVLASEELDHPNGIAVLPDGDLLVVAFGPSGTIYHVHDGERTDVTTLDATQFDGVAVLPGGDVLVSSWGASAVLRVAPDGSTTVAVPDVAAPADFGYDAGRDRIMIPLFQDDAVVFAPAR